MLKALLEIFKDNKGTIRKKLYIFLSKTLMYHSSV